VDGEHLGSNSWIDRDIGAVTPLALPRSPPKAVVPLLRRNLLVTSVVWDRSLPPKKVVTVFYRSQNRGRNETEDVLERERRNRTINTLLPEVQVELVHGERRWSTWAPAVP
jgi:hypothetical protein